MGDDLPDEPGAQPSTSAWRRITDATGPYDCTVVRTPWLGPGDDLTDALLAAIGPLRCPGDTAFVSEKVAVLLTGATIPIYTVRVGRLARLLVRFVRPRTGSRGLSVPEKMQYVVDHTGTGRVLLAATISAITRPFGRHGLFYDIAGSLARDLDGGRPPYEHLLFPPLEPAAARHLAAELEVAVGIGVAIVDLNDYGGTIRATSPSSLPAELLARLLRHNPLGQRDAGTPFGLLRPIP